MNVEVFAEWMRRQGHYVFRTQSSYWYEAGPRVFQAFPYHWLIRPSAEELQSLMKRGVLALRYSTPLDFPDGKASYQIYFHNPYGLELLNRKVRGEIKHGVKSFRIEQISFERLAKDGWSVQQNTLARQGRSRSMTQPQWESLCRAAIDLPGFEAWAALADNEVAAALIICQVEDTSTFLYSLSHQNYLRDRVNNALFYRVSADLLQRAGISRIFVTHQSLDAPATLDDFKFRMGGTPLAIRQRVDFHPILRPFVSRPLHRGLVHLLRRDPGSPLLAKAEGMIRFYLEGRSPLKDQNWPECLVSGKEKLLNSLSA